MNDLKIAFINIKKLYKKNLAMFIIIISSIAISIFGILFYSGYFLYGYYDYNKSKEALISIEMNVSNNRVNTQSVIDYIKRDYMSKINDFALYRDLYVKDKGYSSDVTPKIIGKYNENYGEGLLCGENFTIDETKNYVLIDSLNVQQMKYSKAPVGEKINIEGHDFEIKGIYSIGSEINYIVPIEYFINNFNTKSIIVKFQSCSKVEANTWIADLHRIKGVEKVSFEMNNNPFKSSDFLISFIQILLIFSLSFLCIFLMIDFWVKKSQQTFSVYSICGCSPRKKKKIIGLQIYSILIFGVLLGLIAFSCFAPLFEKFELVYIKSVLDYLMILIIVLVILGIYSIVFALKKGKENCIYMIEE